MRSARIMIRGCFADRAEIDPMLEYEPWWNTINTDAEWQWTDEEKDAMMALKNRECMPFS